MKYYIFLGGTNTHPCRGLICYIGWTFETSESVMVYFKDTDPRNIGFEIANLSELQEIP